MKDILLEMKEERIAAKLSNMPDSPVAKKREIKAVMSPKNGHVTLMYSDNDALFDQKIELVRNNNNN